MFAAMVNQNDAGTWMTSRKKKEGKMCRTTGSSTLLTGTVQPNMIHVRIVKIKVYILIETDGPVRLQIQPTK